MGMDAELNMFMGLVDQLIDYTMETDVLDAVKKEMAAKINTEVYGTYDPIQYKRKEGDRGLLDMRQAPEGSLDVHYDGKIKLLTVENVRSDWEPTHPAHPDRNVAAVVESGRGYDFWKRPRARPFHQKTENALISSGEIDRILTKSMDTNLSGWSL